MSGYRKKNQMNLARLLPSLINEKGWDRQFDLHSIFPKWRELVGEDIAEYAKPLKIEKGVLWLEVENSAWLQQLQYEKLAIMEALNRSLRLSALKDIKMILPKGRNRTAIREVAAEIKFITPKREEIDAFQRQVSCIGDEKCREALMQFWYLAQACKKE